VASRRKLKIFFCWSDCRRRHRCHLLIFVGISLDESVFLNSSISSRVLSWFSMLAVMNSDNICFISLIVIDSIEGSFSIGSLPRSVNFLRDPDMIRD
jgi:hypothetical protein